MQECSAPNCHGTHSSNRSHRTHTVAPYHRLAHTSYISMSVRSDRLTTNNHTRCKSESFNSPSWLSTSFGILRTWGAGTNLNQKLLAFGRANAAYKNCVYRAAITIFYLSQHDIHNYFASFAQQITCVQLV